MRNLFSPLKDFVDLLYPSVCHNCGNWLVVGEKSICLHCINEIPLTGFHFQQGNPTAKLFWARVPVSYATSYMFFHETGIARKLLHQIKYKGGQDLAIDLGEMFAQELLQADPTFKPDLILPVPLHPRKLRQRGFNQSEAIATGMSKVLQTELNTDILVRQSNNKSQTKKGRFDRWSNVDGIFGLKNTNIPKSAHILLVDDVITTGATLEACVNALLKLGDIKVGIAGLAMAKS